MGMSRVYLHCSCVLSFLFRAERDKKQAEDLRRVYEEARDAADTRLTQIQAAIDELER